MRGSCVLHCKVLQLPLYIGCGNGLCGMPGIGVCVCACMCVWLEKWQKI